MEKRLLLAIALSFIVLGIYTSFLPKKQLVENEQVTEKLPQEQVVFDEAKPIPSVLSSDEQKDSNMLENNMLHTFEIDGLVFRFSEKGGYLVDVVDTVRDSLLSVGTIGLVQEWSKYVFSMSEIPGGVVFTHSAPDGLKISKTFMFKSASTLDLIIQLDNVTNSSTSSYKIIGGAVDASVKDQISARYFEAAAIVDNIIARKSIHGQKKPIYYDGHILWAGLRDRYFCEVVFPQLTINKGVIAKDSLGNQLILSVPERALESGTTTIKDVYRVYVGIQDEKALKEFGGGAEKLINYGMFDGISRVILFFLKLAHRLTNNWGLAIIIITIFIYILLFPLSFKSMLSMKKMQLLQPKIEELRSKFKDNPQKLNTEIMALYRTEKANPFGGCLPMFLQIPVFFALYQLLMRFIGLKGSNFLWIKDLSQPDRALIFKTSLPIVGNELNVLPILMAIGMFFQQKITTASAKTNPSSEAAQQQKIMTIMMPVIFGTLFYKLSAGLVLYWFVNSLLMLVFQWKISKIKI